MALLPSFKRYATFEDDVNFDYLLELSDMRDDLGLFADTSQDDSIRSYLLTSLRLCEKILNFPVISRNVTNYYSSFVKNMQLSQPVPSADFTLVSVKYRDGQLAEQNVVTTNVFHDDSDDDSVLIFPDDVIPSDLSKDIGNPVEIEFEGAGVRAGHEAIDAVRQAIKWHVNLLYFQRASADVHAYDISHIESILSPFVASSLVYVP